MEKPTDFGKSFWGWVAILAVISGLLLWAFAFYVNRRAPELAGSDTATSSLILFYGDTCPHCKQVDEFLSITPGADKLPISRLEVYNNTKNASLLAERAKACKLNLDSVGVPFLWTGTECFIGVEPIEVFLEAQIK